MVLPDGSFVRMMSKDMMKEFRHNFFRNIILGNQDVIKYGVWEILASNFQLDDNTDVSHPNSILRTMVRRRA